MCKIRSNRVRSNMKDLGVFLSSEVQVPSFNHALKKKKKKLKKGREWNLYGPVSHIGSTHSLETFPKLLDLQIKE